jgi:glycosyltransferase involved in cell wall biosynthesis
MKKILFITRPIAPPWDEASKNFAYNLAKEVAKNNSDLEVHILTNGILSNLPKNVIQHSIYTSSQNDFGFLQKVYLLRYLLRYTFLSTKYDIVHLFFTPTNLTSWILQGLLQKVKIIQTVATIRDDLFSNKKIKKIMFGDIIATYSVYSKNKLQKLGFNNVVKIYPGIDLQDYRPKNNDKNEDNFIINFTGEYIRLNAMDDVIESFKKVSSRVPNTKLSLAVRVKNEKDAVRKKEVTEKLKEYGLLNKVSFHDDGSFKMSDIYNLADISIFPVQNMLGKFDVPLAVVEAMACEKPVVISDIPILKEFSNENNSIRIKAGNVEELTDAILALYNDSKRLQDLGETARHYVKENFDIKKAAQKYSKIYTSL